MDGIKKDLDFMHCLLILLESIFFSKYHQAKVNTTVHSMKTLVETSTEVILNVQNY